MHASEQEPGNEVLFRDSELIVSSARVEQDGFSCAAKYISTVKFSHDNPSKMHAWVGFFACAVAVLVSMLYLYLGKLGVNIYLILHLTLLAISISIVYLYLLAPSTYSIDVSLVNGQMFEIKRNSEKSIKEIHAAVKEAVSRNRPDGQAAPVHQAARLQQMVPGSQSDHQLAPANPNYLHEQAESAIETTRKRKFLAFSARR